MSLTVKKEIQDSKMTLAINGVLDISTTHNIEPYLEQIPDGVQELILNFSKLEFIDSTGIGTIMSAIYLSQEKDFKISIQGEDALTKEVFETIGLYQILQAVQGERVDG